MDDFCFSATPRRLETIAQFTTHTCHLYWTGIFPSLQVTPCYGRYTHEIHFYYIMQPLTHYTKCDYLFPINHLYHLDVLQCSWFFNGYLKVKYNWKQNWHVTPTILISFSLKYCLSSFSLSFLLVLTTVRVFLSVDNTLWLSLGLWTVCFISALIIDTWKLILEKREQ